MSVESFGMMNEAEERSWFRRYRYWLQHLVEDGASCSLIAPQM